MKQLFFCLDPDQSLSGPLQLDARYSSEFWKPSLRQLVPRGMSLLPYGFWWFMHYLRLQANQDYGVFVLYEGNALVHYSGVFPGYFRFPFMAPKDLQIGDTWTHPDHRGRGIAGFAIRRIVESRRQPGRRFWYICSEDNAPSIRAVEKAGFVRLGKGVRTSRFGLRVLGTFIMTEPEVSSPLSSSVG